DQDSIILRKTFQRMLEMMRPVINFLNELDADIDESTREKSALLDFVTKTSPQRPESFSGKKDFTAPARGSRVKGTKIINIQ
ncbi:hypothetical protein ACV331_36015, partial [Pseudomonas aeruginosa]